MCREVSAKTLVEQQADQFASALLMPADLVRRAAEQVVIPSSGMSVRALRATAGKVIRAGGFSNVSNTAMANRLITLGFASGVDYQTGTGIDLMRAAEAKGFSGIDTWLWKKVRQVRRLFQ